MDLGKGAIAGLLIDDAFRPIPLATVLLQPNGLTTETNENGEFNFVNLDPERYTLRISSDGHEAKPTRIEVTEGIFEEAQIVARRLIIGDEVIITEHHAAFVGCNVSVPVGSVNCGIAVPVDLSGDSERQNLAVDYTEYGTNITYLLVEMHTNKDAGASGAQKIVLRSGDTYYINDFITEGSYLKMWAKYNEVSPFDAELRNAAWMNDGAMTLQLWAQGLFKEEMDPITQQYPGGLDNRGIGLQLGLKANYLVSLFLGETSVDIDQYCALCS